MGTANVDYWSFTKGAGEFQAWSIRWRFRFFESSDPDIDLKNGDNEKIGGMAVIDQGGIWVLEYDRKGISSGEENNYLPVGEHALRIIAGNKVCASKC